MPSAASGFGSSRSRGNAREGSSPVAAVGSPEAPRANPGVTFSLDIQAREAYRAGMTSPRTNAPQDLAHVRSKLLSMAEEGRIDELVEVVMGLLARVRDENSALAARLQNALRMLYGRRTEKVSAEQLTLMLDALGKDAPDAARDAIGDEPPPEKPNPEPKRPPPHKGRNALPAHLPRKPKVVRVPEAERKCADCGTEKTCIGYIRSEILDFVPAQFVVVEEDREKRLGVCGRGPRRVSLHAELERRGAGRVLEGVSATRYAIKHEAAWRRCFSDGRFEIDNGEVERRLRWVALGRKNFLFAGSDKGAERLAIAYTVTGSCHMNGVNPLAYLTDVIEKLQSGWPKDRLDELLPNVWKPGGSPRDG
ncbi:transposase [Polyangium sp. y55x31]|uniref:transposase domain-containing protein n=1 Tax=Polyangium sp. y55x31 TaxID=3042688 RepID=UPI0024824013|nr:transposase [Polyangium sp. y55x31]MDI1478874.1 transposase [Polyangium sp. y55x31]